MDQRKNWIIGLALFLFTLVLYWPATTFPFVSIDDSYYVYENANVIKGLSWPGLIWSISSVEIANYHPLTLLSHMADCTLFGLFSGGHHLTSILLHALNAVLLWRLFLRLTNWFWPSFLVAALFAWHPLNVESVAWVSERKNVLSTLFFILTLWAYCIYVENRKSSKRYYVFSLMLFALGLAAKSMLVTLPFLLLLLDYWPLRRITLERNACKRFWQQLPWALLLEKIPFLILTVADCWVTYLAQNNSGAVRSFSSLPLEYRLSNIPMAYMTYLTKTFWPDALCVFHPFPPTLHIITAVVAAMLLAAMTFTAWYWRSKLPWLLVGWFWFLGTLVPVVGLVQVGGQAWADRYAYLPLIGLFLMIACGLRQCLIVWPQLRVFVVAGLMLFLAICLVLTGRQLNYWRSNVALLTQALAVNPENATVENLLGTAYDGAGKQTEAIEHYAAAVRLRPDAAQFQYDLGRMLMNADRITEAQDHLATAVAQAPDNPIFRNAYGVALVLGNQSAEGRKEFVRAIELNPDYANAYFNLGKCLLAAGESRDAITHFTKAMQLQPDWPEAFQKLAGAYAANGDTTNAISTARRALKLAIVAKQQKLVAQVTAELKTYQTAATPQSLALPKQPITTEPH